MLATWRGYAARHPRLVEAGLLLLVFAATANQYNEGGPGRWPGLLFGTAACLSLAWRRRHPRAVVAITTVCAAVSGGLGHPISLLLLLPVIVALYELTLRTPQKTAHAYGVAVVALIALT